MKTVHEKWRIACLVFEIWMLLVELEKHRQPFNYGGHEYADLLFGNGNTVYIITELSSW